MKYSNGVEARIGDIVRPIETACNADNAHREHLVHENPLWRDHPDYKKQSVKLLIK